MKLDGTNVFRTEIRIIFPTGRDQRRRVVLPSKKIALSFLAALEGIVNPIIESPHMEHVNVFTAFADEPERYLDMFVDEDGIKNRLPVNRAATAIYHNNLIAHGDGHLVTGDPIYGTAVLFRDKVWF